VSELWKKLDDYQRRIVLKAMRPGIAIFAEQGTGKTYISAGIVDQMMRPGFCALVVVPLANVETTWVETLRRELPTLAIVRTWEEYKARGYEGLLLLHYEAMLDKKLVKKLVKRHWSLVIYDESQRLKARASRASRAAARFVDVDRRVILSGTPIEQAPQDLWAQFRFALPDVFGTRWDDFATRWLKPAGFMGYKWEFRKKLMPKFLALIEPHISRVLKSEVLDLPPLKYRRVMVDLLGRQRSLYESIDRDSIASVDGREVTCDLEITKAVRLQQITGGYVRVDPNAEDLQAVRGTKRRPQGPMVEVGRAKMRALWSVAKRCSRPVVVFCKYRRELSAIVRRMRELGSVGVVSGARKGHGTAKTQRRRRVETVRKFQRGELDALVVQVKAGGVGLDLDRACDAIGYSCTWSFIDFDQMVCRLHRRGQTRPVTVHLLQAANTVDEDIWTALLLKRSVTQQVLNRRIR
jgi:SNF2 family DNA or RNA helicase